MSPREFFDKFGLAIHRQDEALLATLVEPDFALYEDDGLPYGGIYRGHGGFARIRHIVFTLWQDRKVEECGFYGAATDQSFAIVLKMSGRLGDDDQRTETFVNEVWTVIDGRAREARVWYWNAAQVAERCADRFAQLGIQV